ncbi:recombinase family protein [Streptomyces sasae]|uniref:recombinase family protein n=1 Tax=Streptomyces sasae TaxID=1266772 RepID=UPI00292CF74D|nr:recombinase family protein [Streptomyces sasae]
MNGRGKIRGTHLDRQAVIYLRQSTLVQVRENTESTLRQYALADEAIRLGWARTDVIVIDADLGASGRFGADREGFRQVVAKVCLGEVGAVFGLEVSRLARSSADFARLLELARITDTLLIDDDGIYDLADINDRLLLGLKGQMSEAELHILACRMHGAKKAAAARGELRFPLPVGYVYDDEGLCVQDPDAQVQAAIADVFAAFTAGGSAYAVVSAFVGRPFPLRAFGGVWAGQLRWGRLTHARVLGVLNNPCYAGTYVFGRYATRRRVDADGTVHTGIQLRPRSEWPVVIHGHHDGYITWDDYLDNQARLEANCTHDGARPPREGLALCQGIMLCGSCGRPMTTRYHRGGRAAYECSASRADQQATATCRSIAADTVDDAVTERLLAALTPQQIALALAAADEVTGRHARSHRAAELALDRARYEADRAERAFTRVEPENRLVARTLETRWETKLAALAEAKQALEAVRQARPPLPEASSLRALGADLPLLWRASDTHDRDRKRLLRTLIADVTLLPEPDRHQARIGIRWHTGATDEITVLRGDLRTPAAAIELITRLGPTHTDAELVAELNTAGLSTGKKRPFDIKAVRWARHAYRVRAPRTVPFHEGEIGIDDLARNLGVSYSAVYYWITHHRIDARQDRSGRWCVTWNDEVEADCRARIAASGHLNPAGPGARPLPGHVYGCLSVHDAAVRLGLPADTVYYWIRIRRLTAYRTPAGRWCIPWNSKIEASARQFAAHTRKFTPTTQPSTAGGAV